MPERRFSWTLLAALAPLCLAPAVLASGAPHLAAGLEASASAELPVFTEDTAPIFLRMHLSPSTVEETMEALRACGEAGRRAVVSMEPDAPVDPKDKAALEAWEAFAESASLRAAGYGVAAFEVPVFAAASEEETAFLVKRTALRVLASGPEASVRLAISGSEDPAWLRALWTRHGLGPYVAGFSLNRPAALASVRSSMQDLAPKLSLWLVGQRADSAASALRQWVMGMKSGAALVVFDSLPPDAVEALERAMVFLTDKHQILPAAYDRHRITNEIEDERLHLAAFQNLGPEGGYLLAYFADIPEDGEDLPVSVFASSPYVKNSRRLDPLLGENEYLRFFIPNLKDNSAEILAHARAHPQFITYEPAQAPRFDAGEKALVVKGRYEMPVEEIIARNQIFDRRQKIRLKHYMADGRIDLHFRIAEFRSSVDIGTVNRFYYSDDTGMEWEQKEIYLNGTRWRSDKFPEVPLVQPEKAVQVPLDLALDRRYDYRLEGRDKVDGREAYRVSFQPLREYAHLSLYKGSVWIDTETFARLKLSSVQTNLQSPLVANAETQRFGPVESPDGVFWLMTGVEGEMTFTTAGRSTVLERRMSFTNFEINNDHFEEQRRASYESDHQMLRDTDKGFRYLSKTPEGGREVKEQESRSALLMLGGVYYDKSVEFPVPLAGINYFTFRLRGTPTQMNLFYAGVLGSLTLTRPELFGTKMEGTVEAFGIGIGTQDRFLVNGTEDEEQKIRTRYGDANFYLSLPFAHYYRLRAGYGLEYRRYERDEDTRPDFTVPSSTFIHSGSLEAKFDRKGWALSAWGGEHRRSKWEFWGLPGNPDYSPERNQFRTWGGSFGKTFFLPHFQKIAVDADWMSGEGLDRFSMYRLTFFGTRVRGFSGSGIRFDRGALGGLTYSFGVSDALRFDAALEYARTHDPASRLWQEHWGGGLSANFIAPKNIIVNLDAGYGISSDVKGAEGDWEVRLVLMKIFERRNHKKKR